MRVILRRNNLPALLFGVIGVAYYVLNMLFPYNSSLEEQVANRTLPQMVGGVWACMCLAIITLNIKRLSINKHTFPYLVFLCLALVYCVYPPATAKSNVIYVLKTHFSVMYTLALYCLLLHSRESALKMVYVVYTFQLLYGLSVLVMDKIIFISGLSLFGEFDSNAGFILASCIPLSLVMPRKRLRVYVYLVLVLACVYSGQRSAALAAVMTFPLCFHYVFKDLRKKDIFLLAALFLAAIPLIVMSVDNIIQRNMVDAQRGTVGSGRSVFWAIVWRDFWSSDFFQIVFGHGTNTVVKVIERGYGLSIGAHNGWLDIMYTFGLCGLVVYASIIFGFFTHNKGLGKALPEYRNVYLILFILFFIKCTTSHGYFGLNEIPFFTMVSVMESDRISQRIKQI